MESGECAKVKKAADLIAAVVGTSDTDIGRSGRQCRLGRLAGVVRL